MRYRGRRHVKRYSNKRKRFHGKRIRSYGSSRGGIRL